jgi:hypothetical protein
MTMIVMIQERPTPAGRAAADQRRPVRTFSASSILDTP